MHIPRLIAAVTMRAPRGEPADCTLDLCDVGPETPQRPQHAFGSWMHRDIGEAHFSKMARMAAEPSESRSQCGSRRRGSPLQRTRCRRAGFHEEATRCQ